MVPVSGGESISTASGDRGARVSLKIIVSFFVHTVSTENSRLPARSGSYPPDY
jgi:hypothetical protein